MRLYDFARTIYNESESEDQAIQRAMQILDEDDKLMADFARPLIESALRQVFLSLRHQRNTAALASRSPVEKIRERFGEEAAARFRDGETRQRDRLEVAASGLFANYTLPNGTRLGVAKHADLVEAAQQHDRHARGNAAKSAWLFGVAKLLPNQSARVQEVLQESDVASLARLKGVQF